MQHTKPNLEQRPSAAVSYSPAPYTSSHSALERHTPANSPAAARSMASPADAAGVHMRGKSVSSSEYTKSASSSVRPKPTTRR